MEFVAEQLGVDLPVRAARAVVMLNKVAAATKVGGQRRTRSRAVMEERQQEVVLTNNSNQNRKPSLLVPYSPRQFVLEDLPPSSPLSAYSPQRKRLSSTEKEDDETLETLPTYEDESSISNSSVSVSFCQPLVTEVHVRPTLTQEEKNELFYSDRDYQTFRHEFFHNRRRRNAVTVPGSSRSASSRKVQFEQDVVTDVFVYNCAAEKDLLFYSESDLQRFLDEFVSSLNGVLSQNDDDF